MGFQRLGELNKASVLTVEAYLPPPFTPPHIPQKIPRFNILIYIEISYAGQHEHVD
jgi:hypothetical protein